MSIAWAQNLVSKGVLDFGYKNIKQKIVSLADYLFVNLYLVEMVGTSRTCEGTQLVCITGSTHANVTFLN